MVLNQEQFRLPRFIWQCLGCFRLSQLVTGAQRPGMQPNAQWCTGSPRTPSNGGVPTKNGLAHMSVEQCPSSPASPLTPRAPNGGTPTSAFLTELPRRSRTCDPGKLKPRLFLHGHPGRGGQGRGASISRCQLTNFSRSPERKVLLGPQSPLPHLPTDAVTHS